MRDYCESPRCFHCKAADRLLIRPKGDCMATFTYSTTAMNYKTLLVALARLLLHNHEPDFQVFFRAVNSHVDFFTRHQGRGGGGVYLRLQREYGNDCLTCLAHFSEIHLPILPNPSALSCRSSSPEGGERCGLMFILFSFTHSLLLPFVSCWAPAVATVTSSNDLI